MSRDMESEISIATKTVELYTAQINDIQEEDIQTEYRLAFDFAKNAFLLLVGLYDTEGFTTQTDEILRNYKVLLAKFQEEYEI